MAGRSNSEPGLPMEVSDSGGSEGYSWSVEVLVRERRKHVYLSYLQVISQRLLGFASCRPDLNRAGPGRDRADCFGPDCDRADSFGPDCNSADGRSRATRDARLACVKCKGVFIYPQQEQPRVEQRQRVPAHPSRPSARAGTRPLDFSCKACIRLDDVAIEITIIMHL